MLLRTNKKGLEYKINVTMQYVSLQALLVGVNDMVAFTKGIATVDGVANYINSRMIVKLLEYIPSIKKDLEERADKKTIITKDIAYALGSIKGLILSYGYDGANFYITLGLSLIKTVGTAFIIDRLDRLHQVDGVSVAVLIGCICSLPKVAKSFMTKDFVQIMLSLLTIVSLIGINYIAIKHEKNIEINYLNNKDTLKLNFSSIYSLSIIVANTLIKILSTIGIVGMQLNIIVTLIIPIVAFILSTDIEELSKNIDKYLSFNDGCIDGIRQGRERVEYLKSIIRKEGFKVSVVGCFLFLISYNILLILGISTSITLYLSLIVSSCIQVGYAVKSIKGTKKIAKAKL